MDDKHYINSIKDKLIMDSGTHRNVFPRRNFVKTGMIVAAAAGGSATLRGQTAGQGQSAQLLTENRTVRIPDDYDTLQDALDWESRWVAAQGVKIILLIQGGHKLTQNLAIMGGDYSHFWIRSEDEVLRLEPDMVFKTPPTGDVPCLFDCHHCRAPILDCLVDMERIGRRGYRLFSSSGVIREGAGIRNAEEDGIDCGHGSTIWIRAGIATGCGRHNLHVSHGSMCSARTGGRSNFSGATGEFNHHGAGSNVAFAHSAIGTISNADCSNAAQDGISAKHGGTGIDCQIVDASNAGRDGVRAGDSATVYIRTSNVRNAARHGIRAVNAASIEARESDVSGAGANGIFADTASRIDAREVRATNCGNAGIWAGPVSTVNARNADASGSKGRRGDICVDQGGIINATNAIGAPSQTVNQLSPSGIIFQG